MKKIYLLTMMLLFAFFTNAQVTVQGVFRNDISENSFEKQQSVSANFTFDDIIYWVGTGSNKAAFVVQWNDSKTPAAFVWGFKWDGTATGLDMLKAIAKADKRFYALLGPGVLGGIGFDQDGEGPIGCYLSGQPKYPVDGIITAGNYNQIEGFTAMDSNDRWQKGWTSGYWSYWIKNPADADFKYSSVGIAGRTLQNNSWDLWNFYPGMQTTAITSTFTAVPAPPADYTNGFFIVNEEWFGHTNGSVNFINNNGDVNYRIYSEANNNEAFGATTQYGTIYGDKFYFISKQEKDGGDSQYTPGGRLVIANAKTMQKIAGFNNIGGADGRSFVGVDEHKGYIATSNGIYLFDIDNLQVGSLIAGTNGGQIGNMIRTSQYVFAVKENTGVLVINPKTNTLIHTVSGSFHSIAQAKDGSIWTVQNQKLINIHPTTFATTEYAIPTTKYIGTWGAWNAGSFTYSNQQNALFWINSINEWTSGTQIVKFDVTTKTFNENFATIPGQDESPKQMPYGAALRIDPVANQLILNTISGYNYNKNRFYRLDSNGTVISSTQLQDYYWFPAVTVFPDNDAPVVSVAFPSEININSVTTIDLKSIVSDTDNLSAAIVKTVKSNSNTAAVSAEVNLNDELILTPIDSGIASVVVSFNSNGKVVEKTITVISGTLASTEVKQIALSIYPNPATDILNIKTQDRIVNIGIYDMSGKLINAKENNGQVNVTMLPKGTYLLQVVTDKAVYQQKFIKK